MPGLVPELRLWIPSLKAVRVFLSFAGPVCGVLLSKVLMYGAFPHPYDVRYDPSPL